MKRAVKSAVVATSLMLALSSPAFAENGTSGMTGTGATGTSAYSGQTLNGGAGTGSMTGVGNGYANRGTTRTGVDLTNNDGNTHRNMNANNGNNNYRRYGVNSAGSGNDTMNSGRLRANAANTADNDMDWGWLGLLGLLGLAGLRNRNRETS